MVKFWGTAGTKHKKNVRLYTRKSDEKRENGNTRKVEAMPYEYSGIYGTRRTKKHGELNAS